MRIIVRWGESKLEPCLGESKLETSSKAKPGFPQAVESHRMSWDLLVFMKNPGKVLKFYTIFVWLIFFPSSL